MNDRNSDEVIDITEKTVWGAIRLTVDNFLGKHKAPNYRQLHNEMPKSYRSVHCNMFYFPHSHLDYFPENFGEVSYENVEWFCQEISTMQNGCQGKWNHTIQGNYCWQLKREAPCTYKNKSNEKRYSTC
jgi:hypothetical protein